MSITIRDIAKASNISVATVSRVVGNYGYVSKEKRELVLKYIEDLGYTPNEIARSMIKKKTKTIGLVIADIHDPFYLDLLDEIEEMVNNFGYSMLLCNSNESNEKEAANVRTLIERKVDGLLIVPVFKDTSGNLGKEGKYNKQISYKHIQDLQRFSIPYVFIDRYLPNIECSAVMLDNVNTTSRAMSKLIENGYKDIQIVVGSDESSSNKERIQGIEQACQKYGYHIPDENWIFCDYPHRKIYESVKVAIAKKHGDAIFTLDNNMTLGTIKAIIEKKLVINKDIYMLGFDDVHLYNEIIPEKIGVIHQPVHSICKHAVNMLLDKIEGKSSIQNHKIIRFEGEIKF